MSNVYITSKGSVNPLAVRELVLHSDLCKLDNRDLIEELRRRGIYSRSTYWKDIRIGRVREEALRQLAGVR